MRPSIPYHAIEATNKERERERERSLGVMGNFIELPLCFTEPCPLSYDMHYLSCITTQRQLAQCIRLSHIMGERQQMGREDKGSLGMIGQFHRASTVLHQTLPIMFWHALPRMYYRSKGNLHNVFAYLISWDRDNKWGERERERRRGVWV